MAINTQASFGSMPQHSQPKESPGWKPIFHSEREIALVMDKTVKPGFGVLRAGTVMSLVYNGDKLVPYPTTTRNAEVVARAFAVSDMANEADAIRVTLQDSYKFSVGDHVFICNNSASGVYTDGGAITAIDRTTYPNFAEITFTNAIGDVATYSVANAACIYHKGDTAEADGVEANYILDKDVDTGIGENAVGAVCSVVVSNAVLNYGNLVNLDAGAITDLGAVADGTRFLILK